MPSPQVQEFVQVEHHVCEVDEGSRVDELADRLAQSLDGARSVVVGGEVPAPASNTTHEQYHGMVAKAKEYIVAGDVIQVVPSRRVAVPTLADPFGIYRALRALNPSPYMYFVHAADFDIVGASPEMLVRVEEGIVDTHPIAGTRRRGVDAAEDLVLEQELVTDEKERAEHVMLLDLGQILLRPEQKHAAVPAPCTLVQVLLGRLNIRLFYKR